MFACFKTTFWCAQTLLNYMQTHSSKSETCLHYQAANVLQLEARGGVNKQIEMKCRLVDMFNSH